MRRAVVGGAVEGLLDEAQLAVPSDERRFESLGLERPTCAGDDPQGAEEREEALFALKLVRAGVLIGDRLLGGATGGIPDVDGSGRCGRLDPGGGVDDVAGDHPLAFGADRDRRLSREDTGAGAQALDADLVTQGRNGRDQVERGADGALGVVFGGDRGSPHGHHRVADELLDGAAVQLDQSAAGVEVAGEQFTGFLRVALLGGGGEADEVGEENGDQAALGCSRCRGLGLDGGLLERFCQRCTAFSAELVLRRVRSLAGWTDSSELGSTLAAKLLLRRVFLATSRARLHGRKSNARTSRLRAQASRGRSRRRRSARAGTEKGRRWGSDRVTPRPRRGPRPGDCMKPWPEKPHAA